MEQEKDPIFSDELVNEDLEQNLGLDDLPV